MADNKTRKDDPVDVCPTLVSIFKPVLSVGCNNTDPEELEKYLAELIARNGTIIEIHVQKFLTEWVEKKCPKAE